MAENAGPNLPGLWRMKVRKLHNLLHIWTSARPGRTDFVHNLYISRLKKSLGFVSGLWIKKEQPLKYVNPQFLGSEDGEDAAGSAFRSPDQRSQES